MFCCEGLEMLQNFTRLYLIIRYVEIMNYFLFWGEVFNKALYVKMSNSGINQTDNHLLSRVSTKNVNQLAHYFLYVIQVPNLIIIFFCTS